MRELKTGRGAAVLAAALTLALPAAAGAGGNTAESNGKGHAWGRDAVRPVPADVKVRGGKGHAKKLVQQAQALAAAATATEAVPSRTQPLGTVRPWVAIDFNTGGPFAANFTLRGVGEKIEVWVQNARNFPAGDCRNDERLDITDEQITRLIAEFDSKIYPIESELFSSPPDRDGSHSPLGPPFDFTGDGDKIATLVMNIRDANYTDLNNVNGFGYVVGYHSSTVNDYHDRNTMTIDAFDWLHRSGANPPHEPVTGPDAACQSKPAFPYRMESTFAHEYQHLIEYWASPGEHDWVDEGLADYAMRKTGFARPEIPAGQVGAESHVQCFYGALGSTLGGVPLGGPENSLTLWEDQGDGEVLCDYGAAWTFMEYLEGRYGEAFLTALHNEDRNGLDGLQATLDARLTGDRAQGVVHDWLAAVTLDNALDAAKVRGPAHESRYSIPTLAAAIQWGSDQAYASPGAPPNGADFVRLRDGGGAFLTAAQLQSLSFAGEREHPPTPVQWQVVDGALSAGLDGHLLNTTIVREIAVPAASPTLSLRHRYDLEEHWDFGFVQVSTDGGATYASLACTNTNSDQVPNAHPLVHRYVPGYSGVADWTTDTCDLSAHAGRTVLLALRGVTDWGTLGNDDDHSDDGWFVDEISLGGTLVSDGSTLAGWRSETEVWPIAVAGWTVQLVGYRSDGAAPAVLGRLPLGAEFTGSLDRGKLRRIVGDEADVVGALVTYDEPTEEVERYPTYELRANGVLQPGGGS